MAKLRGYAAEDVLDEHGNTKHDKSLPVTLGISSRPEWEEYVVFWKEGKKILDGPSMHIDKTGPDPKQEAAAALINSYNWAKKNGFKVSISDSKLTQSLLRGYKDPVSAPVPYDMSERQAQEFSRESQECKGSPHMRMNREYGVG
jgi:hypothetical protein